MEIRPRRRALLALSVVTVVLTSLPWVTPAGGAQEATREDFSMNVVNMSNVGPGGMTTMQVSITRWTTAEERTGLLSTLTQQGPDALVQALGDQQETGFVRGRNMRGRSDRLKYAWQSQVDGKRHIVLASDQETIFEAQAGRRGAGHKFTLIELIVDEEGRGEGTMWAFAALRYDADNDRIVVESYGSEPLRLGNVRKSD